jgi:hypothetical protein
VTYRKVKFFLFHSSACHCLFHWDTKQTCRSHKQSVAVLFNNWSIWKLCCTVSWKPDVHRLYSNINNICAPSISCFKVMEESWKLNVPHFSTQFMRPLCVMKPVWSNIDGGSGAEMASFSSVTIFKRRTRQQRTMTLRPRRQSRTEPRPKENTKQHCTT